MDLKRPWKEYIFVAFDTETTGKYPLLAEIVEIAGVKYQNGKIIDKYQTLVKPNRLIPPEIIEIHHITNEMVNDAPRVNEVLPAFDAFIKDSVMIAHRAAYDMGFLAPEYEKFGIPLPTNPILDSSFLAKKAFPKSVNFRLATLTEMLKINLENAHRALDDSIACLQVAIQSMEKAIPEFTMEQALEYQEGRFEWPSYSVRALSNNEITKTIIQACNSQLVLEICYKGGSLAGKPRRITPFGVVRTPHSDFVVGLCHRENIEKRFYLNRIMSASILD